MAFFRTTDAANHPINQEGKLHFAFNDNLLYFLPIVGNKIVETVKNKKKSSKFCSDG